jgi:hypothetical protein
MPAPTTSSIEGSSIEFAASFSAVMPICVEIGARKKFSLAPIRPKREELYCPLRKGKLRIIYRTCLVHLSRPGLRGSAT